MGRHWAPSEIPKLDGGPLTYPSPPYPYLHEPFLLEIGALRDLARGILRSIDIRYIHNRVI